MVNIPYLPGCVNAPKVGEPDFCKMLPVCYNVGVLNISQRKNMSRRKRRPKSAKFIVMLKFVIALVISIVVAETGLELWSQYYVSQHDRQNEAQNPNDLNRVFVYCYGDSYTYGWGVDETQSYPSQLRGLLREKYPGEFAVVNRGKPGTNTNRMLKMLKLDLKHSIFDVAVFFIGSNNYWLCEGYYDYNTRASRAGKLKNWFNSLHLTRLVKLFVHSVFNRGYPDQVPERDVYLAVPPKGYVPSTSAHQRLKLVDKLVPDQNSLGQSYSEFERYREKIHNDPSNADSFLRMGYLLREAGNHKDAINMIKTALDLNPVHYEYNYELAKTYFEDRDYKNALYYVERAFGTPQIRGDERAYILVMDIGRKLGQMDKAKEIIKNSGGHRDIVRNYVELTDFYANNSNFKEEISKWIIHDVEQAIKLCHQNDIVPIICTYPRHHDSLSILFRRLGRKTNVKVADLENAFIPVVKQGRQKIYFLPDSHCSAKGNEVVARTVLKIIEKDLPKLTQKSKKRQ